MKKLTEIYGLDEGEFDDINKQLGSSQSVAGRGTQSRQRVGQSGDVQRAQSDLDNSKSVFAKDESLEEATPFTSQKTSMSVSSGSKFTDTPAGGSLETVEDLLHKIMAGGESQQLNKIINKFLVDITPFMDQ